MYRHINTKDSSTGQNINRCFCTILASGLNVKLLEEQEASLVKYLTTAANIYFGLSPRDVRILAYECASAFKVKMPQSWETNRCAGPDWFSAFLKRHNSLSIRTPEATSLSRATSFNRHNVNEFFTKLATVVERDNVGPYNIWNVDETGLSTVQKPRGIVALVLFQTIPYTK